MVDVLTPEQRRQNMSRIRGKDTQPELLLRQSLHALGWRFRLHRRDLPGRPDLVFPARRAVIFVHGCFWHGHACPLCKMPATRPEFWRAKICGNRDRDEAAADRLQTMGWRGASRLECAFRGRARLPRGAVVTRCAAILQDGKHPTNEISGDWPVANNDASCRLSRIMRMLEHNKGWEAERRRPAEDATRHRAARPS